MKNILPGIIRFTDRLISLIILATIFAVEIAIIAPIIELIFAPENRSLEINVLFAIFSISMLVVYSFFYKTLSEADHEWTFEKKR